MTARETAQQKERRRISRRNIRRYAFTQSFNRLAGRVQQYERSPRELRRDRIAVALPAAILLGIGLYFTIF